MKPERHPASATTLRPWREDDLPLLRALNAVEMMKHLGGPETEQLIAARHRRTVDLPVVTGGQMFVIETASTAAGSVGFWPRRWHDQDVYEIGWGGLPAHQGNGVATALVTARAAARLVRGLLQAYPSVHHAASNTICRRAGSLLPDHRVRVSAGSAHRGQRLAGWI